MLLKIVLNLEECEGCRAHVNLLCDELKENKQHSV